ncbi:MAG: PfkB family carbohydrate kinase [Bifidobacteriaceae bacterium]|jgi:2-dehydro-3-deoxygluconokinase|nr:PfkB family carbohydrate kinase [Bifidobacteriaceae bacterium]
MSSLDRAAVYIFNPFLHPDLVVYPRAGETLAGGRLLPAYAQDMRPGAGAYTGAMATRLGCRVEHLDHVGDDVFGEYTMGRLEAAGQGTSLVRRYHGDHMVCISVADMVSQGETMVATYPAPWRRRLEDFAELLQSVPAGATVYIYSWLWSFAHPDLAGRPTAAIIEGAAARGIELLLDPNWKPRGAPPADDRAQLLRAAAKIETLLPNLRDARHLVGSHAPGELVRRLRDLGPRTVVLKDGARGAYVASAEAGPVTRVPAAEVSPRDTTGAGDYFGGAYLAAGGSPVHRAAFACAAAGLAMSRAAGEPLPDRQEVDAVAKDLEDRAEEVS